MVGESTIVGNRRNDIELPESHLYFFRHMFRESPESDALPTIGGIAYQWDPEELSQSPLQFHDLYSGVDGTSFDFEPKMVKIYSSNNGVCLVFGPGDESLLDKTDVDWSEPLKQAVDHALLTPEARQFAAGVGGSKPTHDFAKMVDRIVRQVNENLTQPEVAFDDDDGSLNLDLLLNNGDTAFIEFYPGGTSFVGVYTDTPDEKGKSKLFLSDPTELQLYNILSEAS